MHLPMVVIVQLGAMLILNCNVRGQDSGRVRWLVEMMRSLLALSQLESTANLYLNSLQQFRLGSFGR